jgi:hypothetical protein
MSLSFDKVTKVATVTFKVPLPTGTWKAHVWSGGVFNADYSKTLDGNGDGVSGDHYTFSFTA